MLLSHSRLLTIPRSFHVVWPQIRVVSMPPSTSYPAHSPRVLFGILVTDSVVLQISQTRCTPHLFPCPFSCFPSTSWICFNVHRIISRYICPTSQYFSWEDPTATHIDFLCPFLLFLSICRLLCFPLHSSLVHRRFAIWIFAVSASDRGRSHFQLGGDDEHGSSLMTESVNHGSLSPCVPVSCSWQLIVQSECPDALIAASFRSII
ncbi:hypothetical protein B0H19DRAFT_593301 [Mycena capillaripes]|nr:hypothetical protein B0H19DRAFT_704796 [Mycena capillaripes]KAJ6525219.1 hypothetical protein B0H19DRAFT_593301 [Mycena capillaripes]